MVDTNTATLSRASTVTPQASISDTKRPGSQPSEGVDSSSFDAMSSRPSVEEMEAAVADISEYIQVNSRSLSIALDPALDLPIIRVMDSATNEVVRQIPAEEVVAVARFIRTLLPESDPVGVLLNKQG